MPGGPNPPLPPGPAEPAALVLEGLAGGLALLGVQPAVAVLVEVLEDLAGAPAEHAAGAAEALLAEVPLGVRLAEPVGGQGEDEDAGGQAGQGEQAAVAHRESGSESGAGDRRPVPHR